MAVKYQVSLFAVGLEAMKRVSWSWYSHVLHRFCVSEGFDKYRIFVLGRIDASNQKLDEWTETRGQHDTSCSRFSVFVFLDMKVSSFTACTNRARHLSAVSG